jgi:hypothetical protein
MVVAGRSSPRSAPGRANADSLLQLVPGGKGLGRKPGSMGGSPQQTVASDAGGLKFLFEPLPSLLGDSLTKAKR